MLITSKSLIYDIANMAYMIADTGDDSLHTLHRVRDICEDGNIDRVARVLGLAYSIILDTLAPILQNKETGLNHDSSQTVHDYRFNFKKTGRYRFLITQERKLRIKETIREFMVCMVLADWLAVTFPECADIWKYRMESALETLKEIMQEISASGSGFLRRPLSPF